MTDIKTLYIKIATYIMQYFRFDLQLHFFWSLFLTLLAIFWQPLIYLGLVATIVKEALDLYVMPDIQEGEKIRLRGTREKGKCTAPNLPQGPIKNGCDQLKEIRVRIKYHAKIQGQ